MSAFKCIVRSDKIWAFLFSPHPNPQSQGSEPRAPCQLDNCYSTELQIIQPSPLSLSVSGLLLPWLTLNSLCSSAFLEFVILLLHKVVGILNLHHHSSFLREQLALYLSFVLVSVTGLVVNSSRQIYMDLDTKLEPLTSSAAQIPTVLVTFLWL